MSAIAEEVKKAVAEVTSDVKSFRETNEKLLDQLKVQQEEIKAYGRTTEETRDKLDAITKTYDQQLADLRGKNEEFVKSFDETFEQLKAQIDEYELKMKKGGVSMGLTQGQTSNFKTIAQGDEAFWGWKASGGSNSPRLKVGSFWGGQSKDVTGSEALISVLGTVRPQSIFALPLLRSEHLRDHMTVIKTDVGSVNYIAEVDYTLNAAPVAEGGVKPTSSLDFEDTTETMKTIAHGLTVSRQQITQIGPLMDYCENRLRHGIRHVEDVQIVRGDGTGANYRGIMNRPGVRTFNRHRSGDTKLDVLRRAQTQLQLAELQADLYLLSPEDWEEIELEKGNDEHYVWAVVTTTQGPMLWKLPVFASTAIPPGEFLTGAFSYGAMIYDLETATVQVFEQHKDYAEKNLAYVRAEQQSMLVVPLPGAFLKGSYAAPAGSGS